MSKTRSAFQQQIVESLFESQAIDLQKVSQTISSFGERAAREGESLVFIIHRPFIIACGWPGPEVDVLQNRVVRQFEE